MKKLNKKLNNQGFTLIELLAVIVILAIIMVITIPTVLNSMSSARANQLQNAADSVADWFAKEYELAAMGDFAGGADQGFNTYIASLGSGKTYLDLNQSGANATGSKLTEAVLIAAGLSNPGTNIIVGDNNPTSTVYYNTGTNRMCVILYAKQKGSFYVNSKTQAENVGKSAGCPTS